MSLNQKFQLSTQNLQDWSTKRDKTGGLVYIAGDLFSRGTIEQRIKEGNLLKSRLNHSVFNPITDNEANDKKNYYAPATAVFSGDTETILTCTTLLAELDREDAGVIAELGVVFGVNYLISHTIEILQKPDEKLRESLEDLVRTFPKKEVVVHYSDIRMDSANQYYIPTASLNHYVLGMLESMGAIIVKEPLTAIDYIVYNAERDEEKLNKILEEAIRYNGKPIENSEEA